MSSLDKALIRAYTQDATPPAPPQHAGTTEVAGGWPPRDLTEQIEVRAASQAIPEGLLEALYATDEGWYRFETVDDPAAQSPAPPHLSFPPAVAPAVPTPPASELDAPPSPQTAAAELAAESLAAPPLITIPNLAVEAPSQTETPNLRFEPGSPTTDQSPTPQPVQLDDEAPRAGLTEPAASERAASERASAMEPAGAMEPASPIDATGPLAVLENVVLVEDGLDALFQQTLGEASAAAPQRLEEATPAALPSEREAAALPVEKSADESHEEPVAASAIPSQATGDELAGDGLAVELADTSRSTDSEAVGPPALSSPTVAEKQPPSSRDVVAQEHASTAALETAEAAALISPADYQALHEALSFLPPASDFDAVAELEPAEQVPAEQVPPEQVPPEQVPPEPERSQAAEVVEDGSGQVASDPAPGGLEFAPVWEVDQFSWPDVCERLDAAARGEFSQAGAKLAAATGEGLRVLAITSCRRGEGRTSLALALARSAARCGIRVAILDADLRHPQLGDALGLEAPCTWHDYASGRLPLSETAIVSLADGVTLFPLSVLASEEGLRLDSPQVSRRLRELAQAFDLTILDASPLGEQAEFEAGDECPLDAAILVRDRRSTTDQEVLTAVHALYASGLEAVGIAENFTSPAAEAA